MKFVDPFIGNQAAYRYLQNQVKNGILPQANLIVGPAYVGKMTLITNLLYLALCTGSIDASQGLSPCLRCTNCLQLSAKVHPNVSYIEPIANGNSTPTISIETVRELISSLHQSNFLPGKRFIIIDKVEDLTTAAGNALLKKLEEPNQDTVFFLTTTQIDRMLPTIVSRCAIVELYPVANDALVAHWPMVSEAIPLARGLPGMLEHWQNAEHFETRRKCVDTWLHIIKEPLLSKRATLVKDIWPETIQRAEAFEHITILESICRDIMLVQLSVSEGIQNVFAKDSLTSCAQQYSSVMSLQTLRILSTVKKNMQQPLQLKITLTDLLLTIYR